jgi:hypothetical protein
VWVVPYDRQVDEQAIALGIGKSNAGRVLQTLTVSQQSRMIRAANAYIADPRARRITRRVRSFGRTTVPLTLWHAVDCDCAETYSGEGTYEVEVGEPERMLSIVDVLIGHESPFVRAGEVSGCLWKQADEAVAAA